MEYRFSNPIDLFGMKRNMVNNYEHHVLARQKVFRELKEHTDPSSGCPVCGSIDLQAVMVVHGFEYRQCDTCTHVHNAHVADPEYLTEFWNINTEEFSPAATYAQDESVQEIRKQNTAIPKFDYINSFLPRQGANGQRRWLDIAIGNGDVLVIAQSKGFDPVGMEISTDLVRIAKEAGLPNVYEGTLLDYVDEFEEASFDVVSFIGIIDILPNAAEYLAAARYLTKPDGILAINVPNYNSLTAAVRKQHPDQTIRFCSPDVMHLFNEESLSRFVRAYEFEPLGAWYYGMDVYELINSLSLNSFEFRHSDVRKMLMELENDLQAAVDARRMSDEIMMVAKKTG